MCYNVWTSYIIAVKVKPVQEKKRTKKKEWLLRSIKKGSEAEGNFMLVKEQWKGNW